MERTEATVEPGGLKFFDVATNREMVLIYHDAWAGWIAYKHPDGQWVTLRKATDDDIARINGAVSAAHHDHPKGVA